MISDVVLDRLEMAGRLLGEHLLYLNTQYKQVSSVQHKNHTVQIKKEPYGWVVGCGYFKNSGCKPSSPGDGWEIAGWLPQAISKDCGCNSRSLQDGWELTGWLAPTSSNYVGSNCISPRDGWEMAG